MRRKVCYDVSTYRFCIVCRQPFSIASKSAQKGKPPIKAIKTPQKCCKWLMKAGPPFPKELETKQFTSDRLDSRAQKLPGGGQSFGPKPSWSQKVEARAWPT